MKRFATRERSATAPRRIVALLALALYAGSASAQWIVHDPATFAAAQGGFAAQLAKTTEEYALQARQYATQLQQLQNMLTSITGLGSGITLSPTTLAPLGTADAAWLVAQQCPHASAATVGVGSLVGFLQAALGQPLQQSQQDICVAIAQIQIDEYNLTAAALGELNRQAAGMRRLHDAVAAIGSLGQAASVHAEAQGYLADLQTAAATWRSQIDADEAMLAALRQQQSALGHVALKGSPGALGSAVRAAAFAAAFR